MRILFVAAENGALAGGKVGGIGDVVGQVPAALAELGCEVTVVTPSHGFLHQAKGAAKRGPVQYLFRGYAHWADLYEVPARRQMPAVRHVVVDHPLLGAVGPATGNPRIYVHDDPSTPFSSDATRFALFCAAAAAAAGQDLFGPLDVVHLHDWHAGAFAVLHRFAPRGAGLQGVRLVFSIHNLGLQGIRPLRGSDSSLEAWFPGLSYDWLSVSDPRWHDCVNLMAAGIRLADAVHTVSPSYSREILQPSAPPGFYGGEGLEAVLRHAASEGRLTGILNGLDVSEERRPPVDGFADLLRIGRSSVNRWAGAHPWVASAHFLARNRLADAVFASEPPQMLLTCVSRLVEQKMLLLCTAGSDGRTALDRILEGIGDRRLLVLLGSGDPVWERRLLAAARRHKNLVFLNGYSDDCADALYACGDLFLMPSTYEPCGISQMRAMHEGQPCVVHAVGGLKDTVADGANGFCFTGSTVAEQVDAFVKATLDAVALCRDHPDRWEKIRRRAAAARFCWKDSARQYIEKLYS